MKVVVCFLIVTDVESMTKFGKVVQLNYFVDTLAKECWRKAKLIYEWRKKIVEPAYVSEPISNFLDKQILSCWSFFSPVYEKYY